MLKTVSSITNSIGALNYKGTWDASTNTPPLASGVGTKGDYYVVSVAGSTTLDGISTWYVGDWAAFNGSVWQRLEGGVDDPALSLRSNSTTGLMQVTGPSAGQTRVVTIPDANATMARTDAAQTLTGNQTISNGNVSFNTDLKGVTNTGGWLGLGVGGTTDAAYITSGKDVLVGTGDDGFFAGSTRGIGFYGPNGFIAASRSGAPSSIFNRFTSEGDVTQYRYAGSAVGSVSVTALATSYNTISDYRLKENVNPMIGALEKVIALKPCTYTWKANGESGQGFVAHELQAVCPDAVTGEKDGMMTESYVITPGVPATFDEDGNQLTEDVPAVMSERVVPAYQSIDTSFLVATLTAAIQELKSQLDEVKSELQILKGN